MNDSFSLVLYPMYDRNYLQLFVITILNFINQLREKNNRVGFLVFHNGVFRNGDEEQ